MASKKKIDKSKQFTNNPRKISDAELQMLEDNLKHLGDLSGIIYCRKNKAYTGGNMRSRIMDGAEIEIIEEFDKPTKSKTVAYGFVHFNGEKFAYREVEFTKEEFQKACIVANSNGGQFDVEILEDGWAELDLKGWGVDLPDDWLGGGDEPIEEENYSRKIEAPIYDTKNEKPKISELFDRSKTDAKNEKIQNSKVDKKTKEFLFSASERFNEFRFDKIADFYAHSDKETQELMEDLALIIIDFDKAIELGFIELSQDIQEMFSKDYE